MTDGSFYGPPYVAAAMAKQMGGGLFYNVIEGKLAMKIGHGNRSTSEIEVNDATLGYICRMNPKLFPEVKAKHPELFTSSPYVTDEEDKKITETERKYVVGLETAKAAMDSIPNSAVYFDFTKGQLVVTAKPNRTMMYVDEDTMVPLHASNPSAFPCNNNSAPCPYKDAHKPASSSSSSPSPAPPTEDSTKNTMNK